MSDEDDAVLRPGEKPIEAMMNEEQQARQAAQGMNKPQTMGWVVSEIYSMVRKIYRHLGVDGDKPVEEASYQAGYNAGVEAQYGLERGRPVNEQIAYLEGKLQTCQAQRSLDKTRVEFLDEQVERLREDNAALRRDLAAVQVPDQPYLGLATTEELFRELISRFKMEQYTDSISTSAYQAVERALVLSEMLGGMGASEREYRTVDGE